MKYKYVLMATLLLASTSLALAQSKDFVWDPTTGKTNSETETHGTAPTPTCTPQSSPFLVSTTDCSVTCGGGTQTQTWSNGCPDGTSTQQVSCNTNECPKDWGTYTKIGDKVYEYIGSFHEWVDLTSLPTSFQNGIFARLNQYQVKNAITNSYSCPENSTDQIDSIHYFTGYAAPAGIIILCGSTTGLNPTIEYHSCK